MNLPLQSRRHFLRDTGVIAGGAWFTATLPIIHAAAAEAGRAAQAKATFRVLSMDEAPTLAAIAAQIIPTDDKPGATEAGVIYFIDTAFATFLKGALGFMRSQLPAFQSGVKDAFDGKPHFLALDNEQQIAYLKQHEDGGLFGLLQFLTTAGMFAMPSHGGNRDHAGWQLIGFEHRHAWLPPFGHYDAEYVNNENQQEDDHD